MDKLDSIVGASDGIRISVNLNLSGGLNLKVDEYVVFG